MRGFTAQLVEHCTGNAGVMGSNPDEALREFFQASLQIAKIAKTTTSVTSVLHILTLLPNSF